MTNFENGWTMEIPYVPAWVTEAATRKHSTWIRYVIDRPPDSAPVLRWQVKVKKGWVTVNPPKKVNDGTDA